MTHFVNQQCVIHSAKNTLVMIVYAVDDLIRYMRGQFLHHPLLALG